MGSSGFSLGMMGRDDMIYEEAAALWRQLYAERPLPEADGSTILSLIMQGLPDASYGRLINPHLRPTNIVFPNS